MLYSLFQKTYSSTKPEYAMGTKKKHAGFPLFSILCMIPSPFIISMAPGKWSFLGWIPFAIGLVWWIISQRNQPTEIARPPKIRARKN